MRMFKPEIVKGVCVNGCVRLSETEKKEQALAKASAVPICRILDSAWDNTGEQPIIADDGEFEDWVDDRIDFFTKLSKKGMCFFPWFINQQMPDKWRRSPKYIWNQGMIPSCGSTATVHAVENYMLYSMAEGNPVEYTSFNPMYTHYGSTGGRTNQGISMHQAGEQLNTVGLFSTEDVGMDNTSNPFDYKTVKAKAYQFRSAIVYIKDNDPDKWFKLAKACLPFAFGSGEFYNGSSKDKNGIDVGARTTVGGHAECSAGCYYRKNGEEYIYIQNSHGEIYGTDETGKPKSGYWVTKRECELLSRNADSYGTPFVPLTHSVMQDDMSFANEINLIRKA